MTLKLNLGCGQKYLPGYVNCDVLPQVKADRYFDLNRFPYPFEAGGVDENLDGQCVGTLLDDVVAVMGELHRLLRPGGRLRLLVPYAKSDWALPDPHKHFFTEQSMNYFCDGWDYSYYVPFRFRLIEARLYADRDNVRKRLRCASRSVPSCATFCSTSTTAFPSNSRKPSPPPRLTLCRTSPMKTNAVPRFSFRFRWRSRVC